MHKIEIQTHQLDVIRPFVKFAFIHSSQLIAIDVSNNMQKSLRYFSAENPRQKH